MKVNTEYKSLEKFTTNLSNLLQHNVVTVSDSSRENRKEMQGTFDCYLEIEGPATTLVCLFTLLVTVKLEMHLPEDKLATQMHFCNNGKQPGRHPNKDLSPEA